MKIVGIDHVQLAMPAGGEDEARAFYGGVLGLEELPKPEPLSRRGGCWFAAPGGQIHLGVEAEFRPARKAHPGLLVADLDACMAALRSADVEFVEDTSLPGTRRCFAHDPFGNRIEFVAS